MESYALLVGATLSAGTVLALAALGLLINEKAGIVNLGAEGMMLCAAIAGFAVTVHTGSTWLGFAAGMAAGALLAAVFGVLVIWLGTNQYATGLALSLFGVGFSAFVGRLHPVGMVFSALLMSMFYIGGELAQSRLGLPKSLTGVFQGLLLFTLLACDTLIAYRVRWVRRVPAPAEPAAPVAVKGGL